MFVLDVLFLVLPSLAPPVLLVSPLPFYIKKEDTLRLQSRPFYSKRKILLLQSDIMAAGLHVVQQSPLVFVLLITVSQCL